MGESDDGLLIVDSYGYNLAQGSFYKIRLPGGSELTYDTSHDTPLDLIVGPPGSGILFYITEEAWASQTSMYLKSKAYFSKISQAYDSLNIVRSKQDRDQGLERLALSWESNDQPQSLFAVRSDLALDIELPDVPTTWLAWDDKVGLRVDPDGHVCMDKSGCLLECKFVQVPVLR